MEEELERRRDEIEAEVLRRVEEAKKVMEAQMLEEMEKRKQEQLEEAKRREVRNTHLKWNMLTLFLYLSLNNTLAQTDEVQLVKYYICK